MNIKSTFNKLLDIQNATSVDEAKTDYKAGFKDGAPVMIEVMA